MAGSAEKIPQMYHSTGVGELAWNGKELVLNLNEKNVLTGADRILSYSPESRFFVVEEIKEDKPTEYQALNGKEYRKAAEAIVHLYNDAAETFGMTNEQLRLFRIKATLDLDRQMQFELTNMQDKAAQINQTREYLLTMMQ